MDMGKKDHSGKVPFSSKQSKATYYQHFLPLLKLTLITWLRQCLSDSPTGKLLFLLPFPWCALWKEVCVQLLLKERGATQSFGFLLQGIFIYFFLTYYFIQSFIYIVWTHEYLFYTLGYNIKPFSCTVYFSSGHWDLFQLSPCHTHTNLFFFFSSLYFWILKNVLGSSYVLSALVSEPVTFPRIPGYFGE